MSTAASPHPSKTLPGIGPLVVMGVSGCGKTSVGKLLAAELGYVFIEGDGLHSQASVEKMTKGIPLTDEDRLPWLLSLGEEMATNRQVVISCSALKRSYRSVLRNGAGWPISFVLLNGSRETLAARMAARNEHFMPLSLLESQLNTLEPPTNEADIVTIDIGQPLEHIVSTAITETAKLAQDRDMAKSQGGTHDKV
ncbi:MULTISPECIES: gluconokinase [unclassified Rhizobium]|uniref:gluconokinase n=1 Tax=unclassified Rhizobium TaxID=2613769 RepID=UPI001ADBEA7E|nr:MULTISPECIES: gluconokinase [unclassified Rhizobium]MBO9127200.1 gluconokinase [Rhizobium sp. 16-488-2b]MBO9177643.1 gluconokinase [Rhizobium sp. 16-488-2a]